MQRADEAIYERRNTAVELERKIKENELNTQIAVEQKQRQVRETKLQADLAVERGHTELVDQRVENERKESQARAVARSVEDAQRFARWESPQSTGK